MLLNEVLWICHTTPTQKGQKVLLRREQKILTARGQGHARPARMSSKRKENKRRIGVGRKVWGINKYNQIICRKFSRNYCYMWNFISLDAEVWKFQSM